MLKLHTWLWRDGWNKCEHFFSKCADRIEEEYAVAAGDVLRESAFHECGLAVAGHAVDGDVAQALIKREPEWGAGDGVAEIRVFHNRACLGDGRRAVTPNLFVGSSVMQRHNRMCNAHPGRKRFRAGP